jgi:hypothetical protein
MKALLLLICLFLNFCDTRKDNIPAELKAQFLCKVGVICNEKRGTKFGIIGDSWTDLLFGVPAIETLRVQLEKNYGYRFVGSTLGGQTLAIVNSTLLYTKVIDEAGPDIKYILLSLGGNDLQGNPAAFLGRFGEEKTSRFNLLNKNLLALIQSGNLYKMQKYGGEPPLWIIHGYDYPNPDIPSMPNSTSCRPTLKSVGFSDTEINSFTSDALNDFNVFLRDLTTREARLRYIDLRGSIGGPPFSAKGNMYDCIHPTTGGFNILAKRYVSVLEGFTNYEK